MLETTEKYCDGTEAAVKEKEGWWESVSYKDAKIYIKDNVRTMARSFIAVGYYLKQIRDREMYREDGYASIWDFARETYGMSRTTASRWMEMNDRFSEGGNSPILGEKYQEFGKSQLQEMLYLPEEKLEEVKPEMTVAQIRGLKDQEKRREEEEEEADTLPPCITGRSESGICEAAAYCINDRECCTGCKEEDCPIRCEHVAAPKEPDKKDFPESEQSSAGLDHESGKPEQEWDKETRETPHADQPTAAGRTEEAEEAVRQALDVIERAAETQQTGKECATSHTEDIVDLKEGEWEEASEDTAEYEETEEDPDLTPEKMLKTSRRTLKSLEKAFGSIPKKDQPHRLAEERIMAEALECLVAKRRAAAGQEEFPQPELPPLKNNDQRKTWLRSYQDWGLWYEDRNIGAKYYKYDFTNGARLIVEGYLQETYCGDRSEAYYFHLVGGPKPPTDKCAYGKWTRHERYDKYPDSESELVEFLKHIQKKG